MVQCATLIAPVRITKASMRLMTDDVDEFGIAIDGLLSITAPRCDDDIEARDNLVLPYNRTVNDLMLMALRADQPAQATPGLLVDKQLMLAAIRRHLQNRH